MGRESWMATAVMATLAATAGCSESTKRPIGAVCSADAQCESGICGGGVCLDPDGDEDGDGLINSFEAGLGTDPVSADSDGDGIPDGDEVGDVAAPNDTDGDGHIDAVESETADADADCIPDQRDANDIFKDAPSEAFPEACGDDTWVGPAPGELECVDVKTPLADTCARDLGAAIVDCFDPEGCLTTGQMDGTNTFMWENGARITFDEVGGTYVVRASSGTTCYTVSQIETADDDTYEARYQLPSGRTWTVEVLADESVTITCPDSRQVRLTPAESAAMSDCVDTGSYELCSTGGQCTSDNNCLVGQECCDFGSSVKYCLPAGACPTR